MVIGISGKAQSGKDTVGKIIQILLNSPQLNNEGVLTFLRKDIVHTDHTYYPYNWSIKKFADKLKDIVCLLIGCTREQLEDETFKNIVLEDWGEIYHVCLDTEESEILYSYLTSKEAAEKSTEIDEKFDFDDLTYVNSVKMTPRLMMQLIGTECGRNIIHPQIWVNSTFADYVDIKPKRGPDTFDLAQYRITSCVDCKQPFNGYKRQFICNSCYDKRDWKPKWIITDMRFPNELTKVEQHGFAIRVERGKKGYIDTIQKMNTLFVPEHPSETALDDTHFTYTIGNNGTLEELIDQVRQILSMENLLNSYKITNGN